MSQHQDELAGRWALPAPAVRSIVPVRPADVLRELVTLLRSYGLDHVYWSACALCGVLSLPHVTVWLCDGQFLTWRRDSTHIRWPAADTEGAAQQLVMLAKGRAGADFLG
jgi:hypothetical protein